MKLTISLIWLALAGAMLIAKKEDEPLPPIFHTALICSAIWAAS